MPASSKAYKFIPKRPEKKLGWNGRALSSCAFLDDDGYGKLVRSGITAGLERMDKKT